MEDCAEGCGIPVPHHAGCTKGLQTVPGYCEGKPWKDNFAERSLWKEAINMKKMLALFLALLLVLSLVACGSSEPEEINLSVKFGTVTGVEPTGFNAYAIVLSMDEPSSNEGAERDVYISAVDYIFTHAPDYLEELSVNAYNQDGESIVSFTMPSYLITSLREVEAQGSWGTQGFAASFYFNHDAYDVLVASCEPYNN